MLVKAFSDRTWLEASTSTHGIGKTTTSPAGACRLRAWPASRPLDPLRGASKVPSEYMNPAACSPTGLRCRKQTKGKQTKNVPPSTTLRNKASRRWLALLVQKLPVSRPDAYSARSTTHFSTIYLKMAAVLLSLCYGAAAVQHQ